ncbi:MAG: hypothetical protein ACO3JH_00580 [Flavobacteriaceae bacterium]
MGVGEDAALGNAIAVTVIATGFGKEQQHEISNTEAKKIIHSLEDEQKIVHDLSEKSELSSTPVGLLFEEEETLFTQQPVKPKPEYENPLIHMNSILYDIEVECELVSNEIVELPNATVETDGKVLDPFSLEVIEPLTYEPEFNQEEEEQDPVEEEVTISFEMEQEHTTAAIDFEATTLEFESVEESSQSPREETQVEEEFIPLMETPLFSPEFENVTDADDEELSEPTEAFNQTIQPPVKDQEDEFVFNEVSTSLFEMNVVDPEFVEVENQFEMDFEQPLASTSNSVPEEINQEELTEPSFFENEFQGSTNEIHFEIKEEKVASADETKQTNKEIIKAESEDPFDQSIAMSMAAQNEKRKAHLKAFNYQFKHQMQKVDDMEREPAYKRQGVALESEALETFSRLTLDVDQNEEIQLRSNNSFLHDNVD